MIYQKSFHFSLAALSFYFFDSLLKAVQRAWKFLSQKSSENLPSNWLTKSSFTADFSSLFWKLISEDERALLCLLKLIRVVFLHQTAFASAARFHYPRSCCKIFCLECFGSFWTFSEFDWIKEKMFHKIYSSCRGMWVFSCFLTCNIRFWLLKNGGALKHLLAIATYFVFFVAITLKLFPCPLSLNVCFE